MSESEKDQVRWEIRVVHIRKEIENIKIFTRDMTFDDFQKDSKTVYAVIRSFQIIGESTKRIPDNIRSQYQSVPWKSMAGFRDKLVHDYDQVDLQMTWNILIQDIPGLESAIATIPVSIKD